MESYIRFTVNNTSAQAIQLQGSCYSLFDTLRIENVDGTDIERIDQFGSLMSMLSDYQLPLSWRNSIGNATMGFASKKSLSSLTTAAGGAFTQGSEVDHNDDTVGCSVIAAGTSRTFTMPLIGLLGQAKWIPLKYLSGAVTLELTLAPVNMAFVSAGAITYNLAAANYVGTVVNFDGQFESGFAEVLRLGGVQIHSPSYKYALYNAPAGFYVVPISERARSIKSIFMTQHLTADLAGATTVYKTNARTMNTILSYQFIIGSKLFPQHRVNVGFTNPAEAFAEMNKALGGSLNAADGHGTVVTAQSYVRDGNNGAVVAAAGVAAKSPTVGHFAIGIDLESYSGSGLESGINTADQSLPINLSVTRTGGGVCRVNTWCLVDQIVTVLPNGTLAVSK